MIRKIIKNSTSNISVFAIKLCITFVMAPLIVRSLGNYDYGIWELVFSFVGYMELLDIGLQPAIVRYVARYNALGNKEELRNIYSTSIVFMGAVGFLIFLFFAIWAVAFPWTLAEKGAPAAKYTLFLIVIGAQFMIGFIGSVFDCFHEGFQRYNLRNNITIVNSIVGSVVLYMLFMKGGGLLSLALVNMIGFSVKYLFYFIMLSTPRLGGFSFERSHLSLKSFKELASFGYHSLIQGIAARISLNTDAIVVGAFLGAVSVTYFIISANLINQARNLVWAMTRAFMPLFSDLDANGDREKFTQVLFISSRYVLAFTMPLLTGILFLGPAFIARWMGPEYAEKGKWVLYIFAGAYLLPWLNPFSNRLLTGIGRQKVLARISAVSAVINLALSILLVRYLGKEGVALGTMIPMIILEPVVLFYMCRCVGKSVTQYANEVIRPVLLPNLIFAGLMFLLTSHITPSTYVNILSISLLSLTVYALFFFLLSVNRSEQKLILSKIRERFV